MRDRLLKLTIAVAMSSLSLAVERDLESEVAAAASQDNITALSETYPRINGNKTLTIEVKLRSCLRILDVTVRYLTANPNRPKDAFMNVAPPDGRYRPGIAPEDIDDPVIRAKYVDMLKENNIARDKSNRWVRAGNLKSSVERYVRAVVTNDPTLLDKDGIKDLWLKLPEETRKELQTRKP
ncbi:hypothetical protein [Luteolibacter sp. Populi]|uniref:hypothetical protein n=1 Tax=Luteolibacter sp. Populi TaxID=3230487 RepID=UPI0034655974